MQRDICRTAALLLLVPFSMAGCSKGTSSQTSQGKTYTATKGGASGGKGASAGGGATSNAPPPMPADTTSGAPSAASDNGSPGAVKGQSVMNPGAPPAHSPQHP